MKKLMIAAAIACSAVLSYGASFVWTTSDAFMPYTIGNIVEGANQAAATSGATSKTVGGWQSNGAAFTAVITLTVGTDSLDTPVDTLSFNSKAIAVAGLSNALFELPTEGEKTVDYSIVIKGTYTDAANKQWTITSSAIEGSVLLTSMSSLQLDTAAPASWSMTAAPEPTSGLMLLLGVGLMALKRKRA